MTMTPFCSSLKIVLAALILAGLLSIVNPASATDKKTSTAPAAAKPAVAPARAAVKGAPGTSARRASTGPSANHPSTSPSASHPNAGPSRSHPIADNGDGIIGKEGRIMKPPVASPIIPRGNNVAKTPKGAMIRTDIAGRIREVNDPNDGLTIHHGLNGGERVSVVRPNHECIVYQRGRPGFVQHPYNFRGHEFAQRSYFYHGRLYNHFYYGYPYRGMYLSVYGPRFYYGAAFYGWAYAPWTSPIVYGWGWSGTPWFQYYGGYFAPYRTYPSASYWLTDYMISSDLQAAYAAHQETGESDGISSNAGPVALTPEVKQMVAEEVNTDLAMENSEAMQNANNLSVDPGSTGIDHMLDDAAHGKPHVFVVGTALDVVDTSNTECSLTEGDVLALRTAPPMDAATVNMIVLSSKGANECQRSATVFVKLDDLQEMENHMRETIDQGLQELQVKQGKGGLPAAPPAARIKPSDAPYSTAAPAPDQDAAAILQEQARQASQAESEVEASASQAGSNP